MLVVSSFLLIYGRRCKISWNREVSEIGKKKRFILFHKTETYYSSGRLIGHFLDVSTLRRLQGVIIITYGEWVGFLIEQKFRNQEMTIIE